MWPTWERLEKQVSMYSTHYYRPDLPDIQQLMGACQITPLAAMAGLYKEEQLADCARSLASMHSAWLAKDLQTRSISAFVELQGIGNTLRQIPAFDPKFSIALRKDLGDWRDPISSQEHNFVDAEDRLDFYADQGFDTGLTDFPMEAFSEGLDIAGLRSDPPSLEKLYGPPIPLSEEAQEEADLARNNEAHDWLQRFETQIRCFIDRRMISAVGANWMRRRLPPGMLDRWLEKKEKAEKDSGTDLPPIAYADFTDYVPIINKGDNWREIFLPVFKRQESIRESLQRLYPIRNSTMHSRFILQSDYLLLYVEVKRVWQIIQAYRQPETSGGQ